MSDQIAVVLSACALGQAAFCASVLLKRSRKTAAYGPLALFFIAAAIIVSGPVVSGVVPEYQTQHMSLNLPSFLLLGPALWLYAKGLVSETPWAFGPPDYRHLALPGLGLVAALMVILLHADERNRMLIDGELVESPAAQAAMIAVFVLLVAWLFQSGYYLVQITRRLSTYRRRLKELFASNEERELYWLGGLALVLGGIWIVSATTFVFDNFGGPLLVNQSVGSLIGLILIWFVGMWGVRQKPGFEGRYDKTADPTGPDVGSEAASQEKYQKSALGEEQAKRIAEKIDKAMMNDGLYLDPDLSLHKLAQALMISPNYISQTLNEVIGASFFDYVNRWRIEASKERVRSGKETVLQISIDVGFNSRSAFYKAFKRVTGTTPTAFRQSSGCR